MVNLFVSALFLGLTSFVYGQEKKHESIEGNGKIITAIYLCKHLKS